MKDMLEKGVEVTPKQEGLSRETCKSMFKRVPFIYIVLNIITIINIIIFIFISLLKLTSKTAPTDLNRKNVFFQKRNGGFI